MDDLIASLICGSGILGLAGLLAVTVWQSAQRGNRDSYRALQARCAELNVALGSVKDQRNRLALRVIELERYLVPYANLLQELNAGDRQRVALQHENQDLKERLNGACVLVLALAAKAGVRIDQDTRGGWRVV